MPSFTLFTTGNVILKKKHIASCLPDPEIENDGYVFDLGLSPTKKSSIISSFTDLLSDYSMKPSAA